MKVSEWLCATGRKIVSSNELKSLNLNCNYVKQQFNTCTCKCIHKKAVSNVLHTLFSIKAYHFLTTDKCVTNQ